MLRFILRHDEGRAVFSRAAYLARDGGDDVLGRAVVDILGGVEAQPVEMELVYPLGGIGKHPYPHRCAVRAVEVDGGTPVGGVALAEEIGRITRQVIAVGAAVVFV